MSWSISTTVKPNGESNEVVRQLHLATADRANIGNQQCVTERDEQIEGAVQATVDLLLGAGFIPNAEDISVSMSGHANPEHKKDESWSNEFISISVAVKNYRVG